VLKVPSTEVDFEVRLLLKNDARHFNTVGQPDVRSGPNAKYSPGADVFSFASNNGHRSTRSACPFGAPRADMALYLIALVNTGSDL
jgi:hypothetical protein